MYCKPHFKQLFAVKGNYTDGFQNAEAKSNTVTSPRSVSDAEGVTSPVYQVKSDLIAKEQAERAAKDHAEMLNKKEAEERVAAQKREEQSLDAEREQQALQIKKEAEQRLALQLREEKRLEAERQQEALKIQKEAEERLAMERREAEERAKVEAEKEKQKEVLKLKEELHALESDLKERQMQVDQLVKHIDQKKNELILVSSK
jgi:chromosome segregation ATPase